ncbi:MAG: NAD(P)-dependent oxidoreductase [Bacteroidales bacterium]|nr:NAD(P)-dependent oxidoreductase [Bacteroidales bacterium]
MTRKKKVLIVGAGGFAGGFIVQEALRRGLDVYAGVRRSTSRKYLTDPAIHFVVFDFDNPDSLPGTLVSALPDGERWDYIVYNLGATKCLNFMTFSKVNYGYLRSFTEALRKRGLEPDRFLFISSLSALGPGDEKGYAPFTESKIPTPDTRYGSSKLKAELWLQESGLRYIIFRATGLYGPRDHDYFLMFKSISKGFDFSVGFRRQVLSFLYVEDLARAIFDALANAPSGEIYNVAEPRTYTQKEFRSMTAKALGKRFVIPMRMPLWAVKAVSAVAEKWGVARMKPSTLNRDKYHILRQRNWGVDVSKAERDFDFHPQVNLEEGIRRSIEWYRKAGWLK